MSRLAIFAIGMITLTAAGVDPAGVKIDAIAKPASAVTVPIESVTVSEDSITRTNFEKILSRQDLISAVRGNGAEDERLRAFEQVWDQDDVFLLFFKPGEDRNVAVRVAAINRLAEIDVVKILAEKAQIPEVREAADVRLKSIFRDKQNEDIGHNPAVIGRYVRRLKDALNNFSL